MDLSGLNKIFNTLGEAMGVFDFSFFISGFVTFSFLMVEVHHYIPDILYKLTGWEVVVAVILMIYVCGLMSWAIGKRIRWLILSFWYISFHGIRKDLIKVMDETQSGLGGEKIDGNHEIIYSKMWVELSEKRKERISFINQMWVKRAIFEGLITSWLVGLIVAYDVESYQKMLSLTEDSCLPCFLGMAMLILIAVSVYAGTEYARNQIKEVVIAHHKYCK